MRMILIHGITLEKRALGASTDFWSNMILAIASSEDVNPKLRIIFTSIL